MSALSLVMILLPRQKGHSAVLAGQSGHSKGGSLSSLFSGCAGVAVFCSFFEKKEGGLWRGGGGLGCWLRERLRARAGWGCAATMERLVSGLWLAMVSKSKLCQSARCWETCVEQLRRLFRSGQCVFYINYIAQATMPSRISSKVYAYRYANQAISCYSQSYFRSTLRNLPARRFMNSSATDPNASFSSLSASPALQAISISHSSAPRSLPTYSTIAQLSSDGLSRQKPYSTSASSSRNLQSPRLSPCSPADSRHSSRSQQLVTAFTLKSSASRMSLSMARICSKEYCPPAMLKQALSLGVLTSSNLAATKRAASPSSWYLCLETQRL